MFYAPGRTVSYVDGEPCSWRRELDLDGHARTYQGGRTVHDETGSRFAAEKNITYETGREIISGGEQNPELSYYDLPPPRKLRSELEERRLREEEHRGQVLHWCDSRHSANSHPLVDSEYPSHKIASSLLRSQPQEDLHNWLHERDMAAREAAALLPAKPHGLRIVR